MRPGSRRPMRAHSRKRPTTSAPWRTGILKTGSWDGASRNRIEDSRRSPWLEREIGYDRDMVGRLFPSADMSVDIYFDKPIRRLRGQQEVIDADAVILGPGSGLVVPECVEAAGVAAGADRIGQPEAAKRPKLFSRARQKQRVARPGRRVAGIKGGWNNIVVARQDQRLFPRKAFTGVVNKPLHPFDFVCVFVPVRRIAIGQINRCDAQHATSGRYDGFQESGMIVGAIAGQSRRHLLEGKL